MVKPSKPLVWLFGEVKNQMRSSINVENGGCFTSNNGTMEANKEKQLIDKGFRVGSVEEFLSLSPEEAAYLEIRLELSELIKIERLQRGLTQYHLAKQIGSIPSRVAKFVAGEPFTSLEFMMKT